MSPALRAAMEAAARALEDVLAGTDTPTATREALQGLRGHLTESGDHLENDDESRPC